MLTSVLAQSYEWAQLIENIVMAFHFLRVQATVLRYLASVGVLPGKHDLAR